MAAIYPNTSVSNNADISVINYFAPYVYFDTGEPLSNGLLYFGLVGTDGKLPENRKKVYAILQNGASISLQQPIQLSAGGVPQYNGSPVLLATDGSYSLRVEDKDGAQVYTAKKISAKTLLGYSGVIPEEVKEYDGALDVTFSTIEASTASFYISEGAALSPFNGRIMLKGTDYEVVNEATIRVLSTYPAGSFILGRVLDPTGETVNVSTNSKPLYIYDNRSAALPQPLVVGDNVLLNGGDILDDGKGGSYLVVAGGTGAADNLNYIDLDNGLQLKLKTSYRLMNGYSETTNSIASSAGVVNLDISSTSVFNLTLTESITQINIINASANQSVKIELKVTQNSSSLFGVTWNVNGVTAKASGGLLPTVTQTLSAVDRYIILTDDGGASSEVITVGQDIK